MQRICALLVLSGAAAAAYGQAPSFLGLGDLPGGMFKSWANAVSADGRVVVGHGPRPARRS
jgi:hypothetical protein